MRTFITSAYNPTQSRAASWLTVALVFTTTATGAQSADLSWQWTPGDERLYDIDTETTLIGGPAEIRIEIDLVIQESVRSAQTGGAESNENALVEVVREIQSVSVNYQQGEVRAKFDSRTGKVTGDASAIAFYQQLVGVRSTWTIDETGQIVSASSNLNDPLASGLASLGGSWPSADDPQQQRQLAQSALAVIPGRVVKRGQTWDALVEQPTPVGTVRSSQKHRLSRLNRSKGQAVITTTGEFLPIEFMSLSGEFSGGLVFDIERGIMLEQRVETTLNASSDAGLAPSIELRQTATWKLQNDEKNTRKRGRSRQLRD